MTKQDELMRKKKRLLEQAVEQATAHNWEESLKTNQQLLLLGEEAESYNRMGKAYLELGRLDEAREAYQSALGINHSNVIARKNIARLDNMTSRGDDGGRTVPRQNADPQLFLVETGKTALTTLTAVTDKEAALRLVSGEMVELQYTDKAVSVVDGEGRTIGQLEPLLAQRLIDLHGQGNRYAAAIANTDGNQIKVLIREVFQTPELSTMVAFPGKLGGDIANFRTYVRDIGRTYEMEDSDAIEDEEFTDEEVGVEIEDDFFRGSTVEEEEVRLDELEADLGTTDEEEEES